MFILINLVLGINILLHRPPVLPGNAGKAHGQRQPLQVVNPPQSPITSTRPFAFNPTPAKEHLL